MENINKLTRLLGADRIMTQEDVQQILLGVMEILKNYKQGTESINEETKSVVNQLLERVVEINNQTVNKAGTILDERLGEVETVLKGLQQMIQDVEVIASNVKDGKDADEERVIEEVVSRIKVDPTVLTVSAQEIRDKLSSLKEDDRLDTSAIKGFDLYSKKVDLDYAVQTLQHQTSFLINKGGLKTVSHDASLSGDGTPENPLKVESTSGLTLQTNGTPNGDQTLLNLQAGTNITLTDNGTGTVTIDATGGSGSPGGSDTQLQYNNAGSFGGISGATTNGTTVTFTTGNLIGADVKANSSAGLQILSNAGTVTALFGAGGGANSTLYGGTKLDYATASTVPYLDASKNLISSAVTPTELDYVSGVTSSIQTQIGTKVTGPASATDNAVVRFDNTTGKLVQDSAVTIADTSGDITGGKYNKVTITAPATGSTLTIADGQTLTVNGSATITNGTHSGTNTGDQTASTLAIAKLSTPAVDTVQEYLDSTGSSGYFSGGEITNGAAGTVNIAAGAGFIRATNSTTAQLLSFEWSAFSNVAIASDTTKYIYISYNGGSPTYVLSATATDEDPTKILVGIATNEGGTIVATLNAGVRLDESIGEAGRYLRRVFGFVRDSSVGGLIVSGTGTRNIALSAGTLWYGRTMYNISAIDTSGAGTFATYYRNGSGGFTKTSSVTQWNNTKYDDGTGTLATLTANKWAVAWLYVSADGLFYYIYGRASHNSQAAAETEALPATLPNVITAGTLLVGRLIFQKSASTATFYSAFTNTFSNTGVTLHNDLGSIQGGTTGEYYHLTSAEYTGTGTGNFVRATSPTLTTPAIGTPSSGTLTNCTGLPVAGITASTSTALGVGSIELGNASDTTISRSSAGVLAVEGVVIPSISSTDTLTNKFITPQLQSVTDAGGTLTPVAITNDMVIATALSQATTIAAPSGSPVQGERLVIRLKDNGTARALTWNAIYRAIGVTLPTTTVINKTVYVGCIYNSTDTKWDAVAVAQEA